MTKSSRTSLIPIAEAILTAVVFLTFALTGNCHCNGCGFDKDYVEMWSGG